MITSNLLGGLGNYMFQIATTYSLSLDNNDDNIFNINEGVTVHQKLNTYLDNILRKIVFVEKQLPTTHTYGEPHFHYTPIPYTPNLRLNGYYQSEKYFKHNRDKILDLFSIDETSKKEIYDTYNDVLKNNTCSIHVRRGDYLGLPNHHPVCDISYYNDAISKLPKDTIFLVFSDDIQWCKTVFSGTNFIFIENNKDYIDMWLMSLCDNNIIANSSFSWWGAWLNDNDNKIVITPNKWFGSLITHNTNDLIPETWEKI